MKRILAIMNKELRRVFRSPAALIALLAPGLLIYVMYSIMGTFGGNSVGLERAREETFVVYAYNMPYNGYVHTHMIAVRHVLEFENDFYLRILATAPTEAQVEELLRGDADLVLDFEVVFEPSIFVGVLNPVNSPRVEVFYNPFNAVSDLAFTWLWLPSINSFQNQVVYELSGVAAINPDIMFANTHIEPTFDANVAFGGILADFIPMMLLIFLFSACMTIVAESIAGEKERGTISTLLATPAKRSEIAIGKIAPLCIIATVSALSSFLGIMLSIPALLGGSVGLFDIFTFGEMTLLFFILISTVVLIVAMMAAISAFAKNIKEATMMISVLMFVAMGASMLKMIIDIPTAWFFYLIPLFNTSASLAAVMSFEIIALNLAVTVISNIVFAIGLGWVLTKLFNSEKIMFAK